MINAILTSVFENDIWSMHIAISFSVNTFPYLKTACDQCLLPHLQYKTTFDQNLVLSLTYLRMQFINHRQPLINVLAHSINLKPPVIEADDHLLNLTPSLIWNAFLIWTPLLINALANFINPKRISYLKTKKYLSPYVNWKSLVIEAHCHFHSGGHL